MAIRTLQKIVKENKYARLVHFPGDNKFVIFENDKLSNATATKSKEIAVFNNEKDALSYWEKYSKNF